MNIEQAKSIPIPQIMERIGVAPFRENEREIRYLSPLRQERTASFHVHRVRNVWYDFGEGKGGNSIDLGKTQPLRMLCAGCEIPLAALPRFLLGSRRISRRQTKDGC